MYGMGCRRGWGPFCILKQIQVLGERRWARELLIAFDNVARFEMLLPWCYYLNILKCYFLFCVMVLVTVSMCGSGAGGDDAGASS